MTMTMKEEFFCSLCLDVTSENSNEDYFVSTECGHLFHYECLVPAYNNGYRTCPICRDQLKLDKLRKLFGIQVKRSTKRSNTAQSQSASTSKGISAVQYDHKFKVIIVGDAGVGKSCLMQRYADGTYTSKLFSTVGCDWRSKTVIIGDKIVSLSIWDTVGQEKHRSLITNYVRDAHGALICYDISNASSFEDIEYWYEFVKNHSLHDCVKILVGNKTDLEEKREVPKADAKKLAQKVGIPFFETSAKDAYNVEATFRTLAARILENDNLIQEIESRKQNIRLKDQESSSNPLTNACSMSWHWTKYGVTEAARGIRHGWQNLTSSNRQRHYNQE
ncbi:unnamed protein product [Orchesella dallaii]|uniref:RING-type domain-containing protein n=1 Tax=Orchesella dallaii TaxID=48710 RepID=A0ABP1PWX9_9HEXA